MYNDSNRINTPQYMRDLLDRVYHKEAQNYSVITKAGSIITRASDGSNARVSIYFKEEFNDHCLDPDYIHKFIQIRKYPSSNIKYGYNVFRGKDCSVNSIRSDFSK